MPAGDRPRRRNRRWRRVATILLVLSIGGAFSWRLVSERLLTNDFRMNWARCHASLSESKRAELVERNREMVSEKIGLPTWVTIRLVDSGPERAGDCDWGDDDDTPQRVYAMTTRFGFELPALPTVKGWFATHPDNPYGLGLDAAWDQDLYRPFWDAFEQVSRKLQTMGFTVQHDSVAKPGVLQTRSLSLRGDGVTVDFGFDAASPGISLTRYW